MAIKVGYSFKTPEGYEVEVYEIDWAHKIARLKYVAGSPNKLGGKYAGSVSLSMREHETAEDFRRMMSNGGAGIFAEEDVDDFIDDPNDNIISPTEYISAENPVSQPEHEMVEVDGIPVRKDTADLLWAIEQQAMKNVASRRFAPKKDTPKYFRKVDDEVLNLVPEYIKKYPEHKNGIEGMIAADAYPRGEKLHYLIYVEKEVIDADVPPAPRELRQTSREARWGLPDPFRKQNLTAEEAHRKEVEAIRAEKAKVKANEKASLEAFKASLRDEA